MIETTYMDIYDDTLLIHTIDNFHLLSVFFAWYLPSDHEIPCIHNKLVKKIVLADIVKVLFCALPRAHLDIKKIKVLLLS